MLPSTFLLIGIGILVTSYFGIFDDIILASIVSFCLFVIFDLLFNIVVYRGSPRGFQSLLMLIHIPITILCLTVFFGPKDSGVNLFLEENISYPSAKAICSGLHLLHIPCEVVRK